MVSTHCIETLKSTRTASSYKNRYDPNPTRIAEHSAPTSGRRSEPAHQNERGYSPIQLQSKLQWLGLIGQAQCALTPISNAWTALRFYLQPLLSAEARSMFHTAINRLPHLPITCKACLLTRSRRPLRFCDFLRLAAGEALRKRFAVKKWSNRCKRPIWNS